MKVLPCRLIFGYFTSDNGNDTHVKMSVLLIPFLEGAKNGINFVLMIQNWYHQVTVADTVFWCQPSLFARNPEMTQQVRNDKNDT